MNLVSQCSEKKVGTKKTSNLCDDDRSDAGTMEDSSDEKKLQFDYDLAMNKDVMGDALHSVLDFIRFPNKTSIETASDFASFDECNT